MVGTKADRRASGGQAVLPALMVGPSGLPADPRGGGEFQLICAVPMLSIDSFVPDRSNKYRRQVS